MTLDDFRRRVQPGRQPSSPTDLPEGEARRHGPTFFVKHGDTTDAENYSLPATPTAQTLAEYRAKHETERDQAGLKAFEEYMPIRAERYGHTGDARTAGKIKLDRSRFYGGAAMVAVLDARSFRDPALPPVTDLSDPAQIGAFLAASFDPARTLLGAAEIHP